MFERPHHRRIAAVLEALDARALAANGCLFGGGTAMALRHGEYRDLIELAMMAPAKALMTRALAKARGAYGDSVAADLASTVEDLRARPHRLDVCMRALAVDTVSKAALWARIQALTSRR